MQLDFFTRLGAALRPKESPAPPRPPAAPAPPESALQPAVVPDAPAPAARKTVSIVPFEELAQKLVRDLGYTALADRLKVRWNSRMRTTAGLAYASKSLILINPKLLPFGDEELDRTLRHELAHLLAHERAGKRRISPHGREWQQACRDLGLKDEKRCHNLPLPRREMSRPHAYRCPGCETIVRRVRPFRRKVACLPCCRKHSGGSYDERFRFVKVVAPN